MWDLCLVINMKRLIKRIYLKPFFLHLFLLKKEALKAASKSARI